MNICVGIVTRNRPQLVAGLISIIIKQISVIDHICIVENGSFLLKETALAHKSNKQISFIFQEQSSIAQARNRVVKFARKSKYQAICFIDDDCIPTKDWLISFRSYIQNNAHVMVGIGQQVSKPHHNIYCQATDVLHKHWIHKNQETPSITKVFDTKNCFIRTSLYDKYQDLCFDTSLPRASDVRFACHLTQHAISIHIVPKAKVTHSGPDTFLRFCKQRYLFSYWSVKATSYTNMFQKSTVQDIKSVWNDLNMTPLDKGKIFFALGCAKVYSKGYLLLQQLLSR